jgi:hypothetical protein
MALALGARYRGFESHFPDALFRKGLYMRKFLLILGLMLLAASVMAQTPAPSSTIIRVTELVDSTRLRISWTPVPGYSSYDVNTFSSPRKFELEQVRLVTGTSWTITVPRSAMMDGTKFYASVRASMSTPKYASITYDMPPVQITSLSVKPDSLNLTTADSGKQYQFCAYVVFVDGQIAMRNPEKNIPACVNHYMEFASELRNPTTLQQEIADNVQVVWDLKEDNTVVALSEYPLIVVLQ